MGCLGAVWGLSARLSGGLSAGTLVFSISSSVIMPYDDLVYYVDGGVRGFARDEADFNIRQIQLGPGAHTVTFSYQMNPSNLEVLPPLPVGGIESVFIDDVYFLPTGVTIAPTGPPMTVPTASPAASVDVSTSSPSSVAESDRPTIAPASVSSSVAPTPMLPSDTFFDGYETGDFSGLEWNITGVQAWVVDSTNPYQVGMAPFDSLYFYQVDFSKTARISRVIFQPMSEQKT